MFILSENIFLPLRELTENEDKRIKASTRKLAQTFLKTGNENEPRAFTEKEMEAYIEYNEVLKDIEKQQALEYLNDTPKLIEAIKIKIRWLIFNYSHFPEFFSIDEQLQRMIKHSLSAYIDVLKENASNRFNEIKKFIDEAIRNKEKIVIEEENAFYTPENPLTQTMFSGKAINALARARTIGHFEPLEGKLTVEGVNIFSPESVKNIGVGTAKIYRYAVAEFTKHNERNAKGEKIKQRLLLDVKDFAAANGVDIKSIDAMKNFRRKLKNSLNTLLSNPITWTEKIKGKETTFSGLNYIGGYSLKRNTLNIEFTLTMAEYLISLPQIKYPRSLYSLDDRDFNAFAMAEKMATHYSIDKNVIRKTEGKLKVETLLKVTSFPTYEKLKKNKWSWERYVKEPFENALDKLKQCGFLKDWKYCYAGDVEIADEEVRAGTIDSYEKFISLIVKYELNDFASHEERATEIIKKKAEKIKKLQSKRKTKKKADNN